MYTSNNILNSASVLGGFQNGKIQFTNSKDYSISGKFASGTKYFRESFYNTTDPMADPFVFTIDAIPDLPISYTSSVALPKAIYNPYIDSFTLLPGDFTTLTPEIFNLSITSLPGVTVN